MGILENLLQFALQLMCYTRRIALQKPALTTRHKKTRKQGRRPFTMANRGRSSVLWIDDTHVSSYEHTTRHKIRNVSSILVFYVIPINQKIRTGKMYDDIYCTDQGQRGPFLTFCESIPNIEDGPCVFQ